MQCNNFRIRILVDLDFAMKSQGLKELSHFALFLGKTNDKIFKKMQNTLCSVLYAQIW